FVALKTAISIGAVIDATNPEDIMQTNTKCRIEVIAKGSPIEMGIAQGEALREKIQLSQGILANIYGFRSMQPGWMPYAIYLRVCQGKARRLLEDPLKRDFPEEYRRMSGLSTGSGTSMNLLHLFHALEPMLSDVSRCSVVPAFGGCSAIAVRGRRTTTHEPMI